MSLVPPMRTSLRQRSTHAVFRSVCVQVIRLSGVDSTEMCRADHRLLQLVEGSLVDGCPFLLEVCLKHCSQKGCDSLEPFDKLLVKSTQSNELSNFMDRSWWRPASNDLDLFGVHVYSFLVDDVSAEGHSTLKECGFIDAGEELVLTE